MKIINAMFAKGIGGIEQAFVDYTKALALAGYEVICIIQPKAKIAENLQSVQQQFPDKIEVKEIPNLGWWDIFAKFCLRCVVRKTGAQIIVSHGNRPTTLLKLASRRCKVPLVAVAHNYKVKPLLKADHILSITQDLKDFIIQEGFDESNIHIIPNMIDIDGAKTVKYDNFSNPPVIGVIARFVKKKGVDVFLNACAALKSSGIEFQAVIAGNGAEAENLQSLRDELLLNDNVKFIGWVEDKQKFYDNIDIFCLPSHHEPFGIVILEAMKYCKPIVSTASEGPKEIIEHEKSGVLVEIGHAGELAMALKRVIEEKDFAKKIAEEGHKKLIDKYSVKEVSKLLSKTLEAIK